MNEKGYGGVEAEYIRRYHKHEPADHQCSSLLIKHIRAPIHPVWSLVRRFDQPQKYKPFVSRCVVQGNLEIGSLREVDVKSGLPATTSTERLELLDDNEHILRFRIVGGDHRLKNYSSIISLHPEIIDGRPGTMVIESFVVDVPEGNTKDETCYFVEALIKCNLKSLADVSEQLAVWSLVRRFDQPQKYKPFVSRCVVQGNLEIGSLREVDVKSGLPATTSTERLELLDDNEHILRFRIVGGDHRLKNYSSIISSILRS
ncbi:hypothetical protein Nepgr_010754 [Nepenthes gracilis]|uniref:Uncharacterized protein n=1 Tax=Nepenthes gracilis TaxID=150966 RepID=A0AAD3SDZ2_NEPGR|nr:hypothetical protein Nepgr_010754 [Nepenthes gracilis]